MENKKDHPGIYIPPPLFYVITFLAAVFIQKLAPLEKAECQMKRSGKQMVDNTIINTIVPILFSYELHHEDEFS